MLGPANSGCDVTFLLTFDLTLDFYFCDSDTIGSDATLITCPPEAITYLDSDTSRHSMRLTQHFTTWDVASTVDLAVLQGLWDTLTGDFEDCSNGSVEGCLLSAAWFTPPQKLLAAIDLIRSFDAALRTGIGIDEAFNALRALDLDAAAVAQLQVEANLARDIFSACTTQSFSGGTQVLMADGSHRAISALKAGDQVWASDPETGANRAEPVLAPFAHDTGHLMDVAFTGGGSLTSTPQHQVYTVQHGWIFVSELHPGDLLQSADGTTRAVTGITDRVSIAPERVYDLTVDELHTFYVRTSGARAQDLLVHNCLNLAADEAQFPDWAHTISEHVSPTPQKLAQLVDEKGTNSVWTNLALAQRAINERMSALMADDKARKAFQKWLADPNGAPERTLEGKLSGVTSAGTVYSKSAAPRAAGNDYVIVVKKTKRLGVKHPNGFIIWTSYPK